MLDFLFGESSLRFVIPSILSYASSLAGYLFFTLPFVIYVLARWRQHREPAADPQLGVKVAVGYFTMAGLQTALAGTVIVLYALVTKSEDHGEILRAGCALVVPGLLVYGAHRLVLARTNTDTFPGVRRLIAGINLVLCSALGFASLVMAFQALFAKGSSGELGRFAVSAAIVYLSAWAYHAWRVFADRLGISMGPPLVPPPTATFEAVQLPPPAPTLIDPPTSGPGLPSLGDGAFPPIK